MSSLRDRTAGLNVRDRTTGLRGVGLLLRVLMAAALAVDAYVHASDVHFYDRANGGSISQGNLFRIEAAVASLVALLVIIWWNRASAMLAFLVAASALGAVLLYRYVDVGSLGPLPNMNEPTWEVYGKLPSAYAEGAAVLFSFIALGLGGRRRG